MNIFTNEKEPFTFKTLETIPEEYKEYIPLLNGKVAIIDDCIYCSDMEKVERMENDIKRSLDTQLSLGYFACNVSYRPMILGYKASLIIQDGKILKNTLNYEN